MSDITITANPLKEAGYVHFESSTGMKAKLSLLEINDASFDIKAWLFDNFGYKPVLPQVSRPVSRDEFVDYMQK